MDRDATVLRNYGFGAMPIVSAALLLVFKRNTNPESQAA